MKYYVRPFNGEGKTIETEKPIEELIDNSHNGLIPLKKEGSFIGIDFIKNSIVEKVDENRKPVVGYL